MLARLIVLNTIGLGLLAAAYFFGSLESLLMVDKWYAMPLVGSLGVLTMVLQGSGYREEADWLHNHLPSAGLIFTVLGTVFGAIAFMLSADYKAFQLDVVTAMLGTLSGMVSYVWTELCLRVCR